MAVLVLCYNKEIDLTILLVEKAYKYCNVVYKPVGFVLFRLLSNNAAQTFQQVRSSDIRGYLVYEY